jgi:hypothetical protein
MCTWDYKSLSPSDKRINFRIFKSAIVAWMLQTNLSEFDNPLGFMGYAVAVFDAVQFQAAFPGHVIIAPPVPPVFPAGNPTQANLALYAALQRVYAAYTKSLLDLKIAFVHCFESDIQHLRSQETHYFNVSAQQMWDAAVANHGLPHTEDIDKLRSLTLLPCDRSITSEENLTQFQARHKALLDAGAIYATNSGQKLIEATTFLSAMAPAVKTIVDKYYADTDFPARTAEALIAVTRDGLRRLPAQPDLAAIRSVYSAVHKSWEFHAAKAPSVYAAVATEESIVEQPTAFAVQPAKAIGNKKKKTATDMTLSELQTFYDSCTVAQYCFHHGYGNHQTKACHVIKKDSKFTQPMKDLAKPKYNNGALLPVDGLLPSIVVQPGFRQPN